MRCGGYHGEWEWAGKWAARADDVPSWLPARVTALLLRPTLRRRDWQALRVLARCTPSPNGGWPMGAMALRLRDSVVPFFVARWSPDAEPPSKVLNRLREQSVKLREAQSLGLPGWVRLSVQPPAAQRALLDAWHRVTTKAGT